MEKLKFTKEGFLKHGKPVELSLGELEAAFVHAFPGSERRRWLFDNFERYLYRLQDEVFPHFEVWVNGSFVSLVEKPNDIDFVVYLDYRVFEVRGEKTLDRFWSFNLEKQGLDAYLIRDYPFGHLEHSRTVVWKRQWEERYAKSKPDKLNNRVEKNFVKLIFEP